MLGDQTETSARPSPDRDFESRTYTVHFRYVTNKSDRAIIANEPAERRREAGKAAAL